MSSKVTSLLVPSVVELAKEPLTSIPNKYLRSDIEQAVVPNGGEVLEIPVIDMQKLVSDEPINTELEKLDFACKDWGFFQLVNHGVDLTLLEKLKAQVEEFFKLPMEEKKQWWQSPENAEGFGQVFVVSENQKLDWGDMFYMVTLPTHVRDPRLFPSLPLPLRDTMELYICELAKLSSALLDKISEALGMETREMKEIMGEGRQTIRLNYYPPCKQSDQVIGITPHSDSTLFTILRQLNNVDGLEIRKDGKWVAVKPHPDAFVINVGDTLEIITNGRYRSIEHRATVNFERERLSFATFVNPHVDGEIGPASTFVSEQTPVLFRTLPFKEYYNTLFSRKLQGKSFLDYMRVENNVN